MDIQADIPPPEGTFHNDDLFPFAAIRPVTAIRIGMLTIREKWRLLFPELSFPEHPSLEHPFPSSAAVPAGLPVNILPTRALAELIRGEWANLGPASAGNDSAAAVGSAVGSAPLSQEAMQRILPRALRLNYPWDIFRLNGEALADDFALVTRNRLSQPIPSFVQAVAPGQIFIEEGARIGPCMLNASTGPVYIGRNAEIMEGALIRGPFAACEGAVVKMGARIYGATTIGPYSIVGGEVKNSVLFGYSNKGHDGYLGDAVIGEWCNLGAGTSNSNLKNNAGEVKVWHQRSGRFLPAGTKCGLLMGDYSRSAINTAFNTGTVTGICCNIFGEGLTPKFIPSFSWGQRGHVKYVFERSLQDIANWKKLKNQILTDAEIRNLQAIFEKV